MISVLLYGRNDAHGAQAQRRAALSINSIAACLSHVNDEIVFVDYNSDDDAPTFPETISDTLTSSAFRRLRIVRVRPEHHRRLAGVLAPPVVESISRNVGLRQSKSENNWILSTNTDVIPVPDGKSLSEIVAALKPACYGCPRFELPRFLWENLPRNSPTEGFAKIKTWARDLHLDEVVEHYLPEIGFDGPGDFQLVPRAHLFEIGGFNEEMLNAWHVDSNLMARLAMTWGPIRQIGEGLRLYHCEHTATTATKHASGRTEDDFDEFVNLVSTPIANKFNAWGGGKCSFEVFNLRDRYSLQVSTALAKTIEKPATKTYSTTYGPSTFDCAPRISRHVLPFVIDRVTHLPRTIQIGWLGNDGDMQGLIQTCLQDLAFEKHIISGDLAKADYLLVDGPSEADTKNRVSFWAAFANLIVFELERVERGYSPRKFLFINAVHSNLETTLLQFFDVVFAPFTTRLRPATIKLGGGAGADWLKRLTKGEAGQRRTCSDTISIQTGIGGYVFFGPRERLLPGNYVLSVTAQATGVRKWFQNKARRKFMLEVVSGKNFLAQQEVVLGRGPTTRWTINFSIAPSLFSPQTPGIEIRLWAYGSAAGKIVSVHVRKVNQLRLD